MSISRSNVLRVLLTVGLLGAAGVSLAAGVRLAAPEGDDPPGGDACPSCPNSGIKTIPSGFKVGPWSTCGSGVVFSKGPLTLRDPLEKCPAFVIYEPIRDVPTPKVGFRSAPGDKVPVIEYKFECATRWLLGWFPIPIGSACRQTTSKVLYSVQSYVEYPCEITVNDGEDG